MVAFTGTGALLIKQERERQVEQLGYTVEHDAAHTLEELVLAGQCYAMEAVQPGDGNALWPWNADEWHPSAATTYATPSAAASG